MAAFEDAGLYCVDNMPVALLPKFLSLPIRDAAEVGGFAFVMDLREKSFLSKYPVVFDALRKKGYRFEILFFDAEDRILLQRYSETRRQHPLSPEKGAAAGIEAERRQLAGLKRAATRIIDTTHFTVHDLKALVRDITERHRSSGPMRLKFLSFGFKYGLPQDADIVMDVRFLKNPFFDDRLKGLTGESDAVREYVMSDPAAQMFIERFQLFMDELIPRYEKEGKVYLTIALGCTGGKHRSVMMARSLFSYFDRPDRKVYINHRDIEL